MKKINPYHLNNSSQPIDLNNEEDIALTMKRNKFLERSINEGIELYEIYIKTEIKVEFICMKCGNPVIVKTNNSSPEGEYLIFEIPKLFGNVKCKNCNSSFSYSVGSGRIFLVQSKS